MHSIRVDDRKLRFSAAHFVQGTDYCESLHGHNYQVSITITGELDSYGMVLDFGVVKKQVKEICDTLDHMILLPGSSDVINITSGTDEIEVNIDDKRYVFPSEDCLILPIPATTAELLAEYVASNLDLPNKYQTKICVSESEGSSGCFYSEPT
ncbi:6-pyruvoyl tetrahydropterin synthase family protein [Candidatus Thorarchaeota archaeon]|nr:MAG: 6-pyruvoyl tetrahydropterin synthase family protein [Candidatus Thorarchaeota archaeon]